MKEENKEQEQPVGKDLATYEEIERARRNLAKAVNGALDHGVGDQRIRRIGELAQVIQMIR